MPIILYQLHLESHAIFAALDGEPNSSVSYDFVPGSAIRGMLIGQYMKHNRVTIDATDDTHRRLFFSDDTRFLNAYPMIDGQRALPTPATWKIFKYLRPDESEQYPIPPNSTKTQSIFVSDSAIGQDDEETDCLAPLDDVAQAGANRKKTGVGNFTIMKTIDDTHVADVHDIERVLNVHTRRARKAASEQQVYRYDAIAAGQTFMGAIYCEPEDEQDLRLLLGKVAKVSMGGARSAGYGLMTLSLIDPEDWQEANILNVASQINDGQMVLTFVSDAILTDEFGEYATTTSAIKQALYQAGIECDVIPQSVKRGLIGGFNRKWGMPLPQIPVIERGSVIILSNMQADEQAIQRLSDLGIGEQRNDGFGRIALGWQRTGALLYNKVSVAQPQLEKESLSDESKVIWSRIRQSKNDHIVDDQLVGIILTEASYRITGNINATQLSRIRAVLANAQQPDQNLQSAIETFMKTIDGKVADKQLQDARLAGKSLKAWLLSPEFPMIDPSVVQRERYLVRLMDAVLERAHKEKRG